MIPPIVWSWGFGESCTIFGFPIEQQLKSLLFRVSSASHHSTTVDPTTLTNQDCMVHVAVLFETIHTKKLYRIIPIFVKASQAIW